MEERQSKEDPTSSFGQAKVVGAVNSLKRIKEGIKTKLGVDFSQEKQGNK